jgi:hypothetical protein
MANMNLPPEERNLTPDQVTALDRRRQWGLALQVISGQCAFFAVLLTVWAGQDLTYSPGWKYPMAYYMVLTGLLAVITGSYGTWLRRGRPEF